MFVYVVGKQLQQKAVILYKVEKIFIIKKFNFKFAT
jgi:hypothetical protein